ncbi:protein of unknown function [Shewanella benthica]|uniref:Uncharacterized protein n=1 Tax=Shewanella benthica TaxID=43661 RepID=A0A330LWU2_9GAMM|nr:protein of unknown function [Shewanella benthica]
MRVVAGLAVKITPLEEDDQPIARAVDAGEVQYLSDGCASVIFHLLDRIPRGLL